MKIIELFAGIGACSKALKNIGIDVEILDAVEIDKYAIKSFNAIHSTNFDVQDIKEWDKDFKDIDLITHGSPCQDFSIAGNQAGGNINSNTRSSLMYETIRIVGKIRPKYVLWENVKNLLSKKHKHNFDNYINTMEALGYNSYYQVLNAKDYGIPQNRERVYTISIRKDIDNSFEFPSKEKLKLKLKDMLEEEVDEKYYLKDYQIENIKKSNFSTNKRRIQEKDYCNTLCARDWKDPKCIKETNVIAKLDMNKWQDHMKRIYDVETYAPTISTMQGGNLEPKIMVYDIPQKVRVRKYPIDTEKLKILLRDSKINADITNKQISEKLQQPITKVEHYFRKDDSFAIPDENIWFELKEILKIETDEFDKVITTFEEKDNIYEKSNRFYDSDGIAPTLMSKEEKIVERIPLKFLNRNQKEIDGEYAYCVDSCNTGGISETTSNNFRIRKLTPKECWRLMGFDDEDFEKAKNVPTSNTQLYKQARK